MSITGSVREVTRQRIFIIESGVPAIEPCLIPVFGVAVMFGMRKIYFFPLLNRHPAQLGIGAVSEFCMAVQVEEVSEKVNGRFFLHIYFTEHLEVANIGHRVWPNILRVELETRKYIPEKL